MTFETDMEAKRQAEAAKQLQWRAYFLNNDNKGLDFLNDMEAALKAKWIDSIDADLCLMGLQARIQELNPLIERLRRQSEEGNIEEWRAMK